jgi:hypothetical protein
VKISLDEWENRPFIDRLKESAARSFEYWL